jgi:hypothetical protein
MNDEIIFSVQQSPEALRRAQPDFRSSRSRIAEKN